MSKSRRPREQTIPESNLNFVVAAPNQIRWDAHLEDSEPPTREQVVRAHFERRMTVRDFIPVQTSCKLKYAFKWEKCMAEPRSEAPNIRFDRLRYTRGYALDHTFILEDEPEDRPSGSRGDPVKFDGLVSQLKMYASELKANEWMNTAILYPLGAKRIDKLHKKGLDFNGLRWTVLVNNNNSSAFLVVETEPNRKEQIISQIERALGVHYRNKDYEIIAPPNCKYAMFLKYGEEPRLINSADESPIAVIFEVPNADTRKSEAFYSELLKCPVRFSRLMNDPEKRWVEDRLQLFDLRDKKIRVLEFYSVEDRNQAMAGGRVEHLNVLFCDTSFSMKEPYEQLNLYVQHEIVAKQVVCLAVTIANECDKSFAEKAFISHYLTVHYFDDKGVEDRELRYDPDQKTIVLQHFPRHMDSFEAQDWFVRRIAKVNFIPIEKTELFIQRITGAHASSLKSKGKDIALWIEQDLYKVGHIAEIFRPIEEPWLENMQGGMGARFFLTVVKERMDVPWRVFRTNTGDYAKHESFTVHFKTVQIGLQFVDEALKKSYERPIFRVDSNDRQGPKLIPCYRLSFAISRLTRRALKRKINSLDSSLRSTFKTLSENGDVIMESDEAWYYCGRVFEDWQPGSETGIIGVMGWSPAIVRVFSTRLRKLLEPIEICSETQPDLFYGVGEVYAKSLGEKYEGRVVVDVDKYAQKIRLLGDLAQEAKKDLESYSENKRTIFLRTKIPIFFPHFNNRLRDLLTQQKIGDLAKALGVTLVGNDLKRVLEFTGSIAAYEKLDVALGEISAEIFLRETRNREGDLPNMDCPTCMAPIGIAADFYRFDCGHVLCRRCTNSLIKTKIDDGQLLIECMEADCQRVISPKEIMHILFGDPTRVRDFDSEKLQMLIYKTKNVIINSNPDLKPCATVDCPGILVKEAGEIQTPKGCTACNRPYCRNCLADPHDGRTCADHERLRIPDESIKQWAAEAGDRVKQCPNCSMLVEKRAGCNHMECTQCHTHFCWVCLFSAQEIGAIYQHMGDEHGGYGGEYINFDNEDPEVQRVLQEQYGIEEIERQRREREIDNFFGPDDDDEDEPVDVQDRNNRQWVEERGIPFELPWNEMQRRLREQDANPGVNYIPLHMQGRPPGLPEPVQDLYGRPPGLALPQPPPPPPRAPPAPVEPLPAEYYHRLPEILPQLDPVLYSDPIQAESLLGYINNSLTREEQEAKIDELVQNANNRHH